MTIFSEVKKIMTQKKLDDVLLTGGGIITEEDMESLYEKGVGKLFGPGTSVDETINYIKDCYIFNNVTSGWISRNNSVTIIDILFNP